MFEEVVGLARQKVGRDGVAHERDTAPPGSILNANISGFWLTMDLLDVDNTTPAVRRVRACSLCLCPALGGSAVILRCRKRSSAWMATVVCFGRDHFHFLGRPLKPKI